MGNKRIPHNNKDDDDGVAALVVTLCKHRMRQRERKLHTGRLAFSTSLNLLIQCDHIIFVKKRVYIYGSELSHVVQQPYTYKYFPFIYMFPHTHYFLILGKFVVGRQHHASLCYAVISPVSSSGLILPPTKQIPFIALATSSLRVGLWWFGFVVLVPYLMVSYCWLVVDCVCTGNILMHEVGELNNLFRAI